MGVEETFCRDLLELRIGSFSEAAFYDNSYISRFSEYERCRLLEFLAVVGVLTVEDAESLFNSNCSRYSHSFLSETEIIDFSVNDLKFAKVDLKELILQCAFLGGNALDHLWLSCVDAGIIDLDNTIGDLRSGELVVNNFGISNDLLLMASLGYYLNLIGRGGGDPEIWETRYCSMQSELSRIVIDSGFSEFLDSIRCRADDDTSDSAKLERVKVVGFYFQPSELMVLELKLRDSL